MVSDNNFSSSRTESSQLELMGSFRVLLNGVGALAKLAGVELVPYRSSDLVVFSKLSYPEKKKAFDALKDFSEICSSAIHGGHSLTDSRSLVWFELIKLNLTLGSEVFEKISDCDVVEIFVRGEKQVFRNLKYIEIMSLSIEEVFCSPSSELFIDATTENKNKILNILNDIYSGKSVTSVEMNPEENFLSQDIHIVQNQKVTLNVKCISPVFDRSTKTPKGYIAISQEQKVKSTVSRPQDSIGNSPSV